MKLFSKKCPKCAENIPIYFETKTNLSEIICPHCKTMITILTDPLFHDILIAFYEDDNNAIPKLYIMYFGTQEWVSVSVNTHLNCPFQCYYCYAYNLISKWGSKYGLTEDEINNKILVRKEEEKIKFRVINHKDFVVMYPSMHDFIDDDVDFHIKFIKERILCHDKIQLLLVTKAPYTTIKAIAEELMEYKERITWRTTITSNDSTILEEYEPFAPSFEERIRTVRCLNELGYRTSVSVEPLLIPKAVKNNKFENVVNFINQLLSIANNKIWIGFMNHIPKTKYHGKDITPELKKLFGRIDDFNKGDWIERIVHHFYSNPRIYWKESIKKKMFKYIEKKIKASKKRETKTLSQYI